MTYTCSINSESDEGNIIWLLSINIRRIGGIKGFTGLEISNYLRMKIVS